MADARHLDDNDVLAWVSGTLPAGRRRELEEHLDGCGECRALIAASAASDEKPAAGTSGEATPGEGSRAGEAKEGRRLLGRYSVMEPIGAGAMGIVYAAYDPVLDRRVALKLLHASGADAVRLRARLLREAQAMARLSHPNVIAIHDVGLLPEAHGSEQVFLAMEFVEGVTLSKWIAQRHPWREVLRVFVLAGRGLAAAHEAGLVHRDFKPDNVLIGDDGRVRVTDFGLARAERKSEPPPPASPSASAGGSREAAPGAAQSDPNAAQTRQPPVSGESISTPGAERQGGLSASLSEQGALVGSPAYMAPEQLRGQPVDARADQFSFSVALYEALYGERPFAGADLGALREAIEAGRLAPPPPRSKVPGWVRRVLTRGLAAEPSRRFPSLDELLDALEDDPASARRGVALAMLTILVISGVVLALRWQSGKPERLCQGADARVRAVWSDGLREKAKTAFAQSGLTYAAAAWTLADQALDAYATAWTAQRTEACEATAIRHDQSPELMDLRISCLDDRLREMSAVLELLGSADKNVVSHASNLTGSLSPLAACADARALREPDSPSPSQKPRVAQLRGELAAIRASSSAGKPRVEQAKAMVEQAKQLGYAPLEAEAMSVLAGAIDESGDEELAAKTYPQAAAAALRAKVDALVASDWTDALLVDVVLSKLDEAAIARDQAEAAVARLGNNPTARGALLTAEASFLRRLDQNEEAAKSALEAVRLLEANHADPQKRIGAMGEASLALANESRFEEALATQERAWKLACDTYGPEHPYAGDMETEYGSQLASHGRIAEAKQHLEHAYAVMSRALGPKHPSVSDALVGLAGATMHGDPPASERYARQALEILDATPPSTATAFARSTLAGALLEQGKLREAQREVLRAIADEQKISGAPDDAETALLQDTLGEIEWREGKLDDARATLVHALEVQRRLTSHDAPQMSEGLATLAEVALEQGRLGEARKLADQARDLVEDLPGTTEVEPRRLLSARVRQEQGEYAETLALLNDLDSRPAPDGGDDPYDRNEVHFLLARALWATQQDRPRAMALAESAKKAFEERGAATAREAAEVRRWIAQAKSGAAPRPKSDAGPGGSGGADAGP